MSRKRKSEQSPGTPVAKEVPPTAIAVICVLALLAGLAVAVYWAWQITSRVEEFPQASDSFGYLQMAEDIRVGQSPGGGERFTADSPQAREMIAHFRQQKVPAEKWESLVAPTAYRFVERSGKIVNQYPPGMPRMLALFPAGQALAGWYLLAYGVIAGSAMAVAWRAFARVRKEQSLTALVPAAILFLGLHLALNVLGTTVSYTIDFFALLALPAVWLAGVADRDESWRGRVLALVAGALMGFAMLMRVANVLLVPGFIAMLWPRDWRRVWAERLPLFLLGVVIAGVVPLLAHQAALTGSAFESTYARADTTPPTLSVLGSHLAHYFAGDGSLLNWGLYAALASASLFVMTVRRSGLVPPGLLRWLLGAVLLLVVPAAYFLTHVITTHYYLFPGVIAAVLALGFAVKRVRSVGEGADKLLLACILLPLAVHLAVAFNPPRKIFGDQVTDRVLAVPEPLRRPGAWIFADRFSGTLWSTHGLYAMNVNRSDAPTRAVMWKYLAAKKADVFVIDDRDTRSIEQAPHPALAELAAVGGRPEKVGLFDQQAVYRIMW